MTVVIQHQNLMEYEVYPTRTISGYTARQVQGFLKISETRLRLYCRILRENCPDEFNHPKGSAFYSLESYQAIRKVRQMFRLGATERQVRQTLRTEGF